MRTHISQVRVGDPTAGHWVEVGVVPISATGYHYTARASASEDWAAHGELVLRGQAGATRLWEGRLDTPATLIPLPVTLPGERLVFRAKTQKPLRFTLEVAWVEPGEATPAREEAPCSP